MKSLKGVDVAGLAAAVCSHLKKNGVDAVLVGGACVTIYTDNRYQSRDLDFVASADGKKLAAVMKEAGFKVHPDRYLTHPETDFLVEFLNPPVAVGEEVIRETKSLRNPRGQIKILKPSDIVKDRLIWWGQYKDRQALEQAAMVCIDQRVRVAGLAKWAVAESMSVVLDQLKEEIRKQRKIS